MSAQAGDLGPGAAAGSGPARSSGAQLTTLLRHAGQSVVVAFVVVVLTFLMVRLTPGNAVTAVTGTHGTNSSRAALYAQFHLNEPLVRQFGSYMADLAHGNLGRSLIQQGKPVVDIIGSTLPVTLSLIACTILVACLLGIPLGLLAALSSRRGVDVAVRTVLSLMLASPPFFLGLLLILVVALGAGWLPAGGWAGNWPANLRYLVLPGIALAGYLIPLIGRAVRQAATEAKTELWYEAALARGLSRGTLAIRHVLHNSLLPVVTLIGLNAAALIAGAVVIESVFGIPGIGQELITAIEQRDYPVIQGIVLVTALVVVLCNLLADTGYRLVDPRTARS